MNSEPSFVSFAQNLEDVMLFRALGHLGSGFYVDIGAAHPVIDSVTKAFYDRGWRGINVEPSPRYAALLEEERQEDRNLKCAVSDKEGEIEFWDVADMGTSTVLADLGSKYVAEGHQVERSFVECRPLPAIASEIAAPEVHFMKVDAEGAEKAILESEEFRDFRPWIIVVEATVPGTTVQNHHEWEGWLTSKKYRFVYFDGLNRFYVAEEHPELVGAFAYPPCVFDHFVLHREMELHNRLSGFENGNSSNVSALQTRMGALEEGWEATRQQLRAICKLADSFGLPGKSSSESTESTWISRRPGINEHGEVMPDAYSSDELSDMIRRKNVRMVDMAAANLALAEELSRKRRLLRFLKRCVYRLTGLHWSDPVELQRRLSVQHLELRERILTSEDFLLRQASGLRKG